MPTPLPDPSPGFTLLIDSWELHLRAEGKSPQTLATYRAGARDLARYLDGQGLHEWGPVTRAHVAGWLVDLQARNSKTTANNRYRAVQQLFRWLVTEGELATHPMDGMKPPQPSTAPPEVVPLERVRDLMKSLGGADFASVRDNAIIRLYLDTGIRRSELAGLTVTAVDVRAQTATVTGKGDKVRVVAFGTRTAQAIDRYLRARRRHKWAHSPALWLGTRSGPMTADGVAQMVGRRGEQVGIKLRPHLFRHTAAHEWLNAGGSEGDLMKLMGWSSPQMLQRYGASLAAERARKAHRDKALGDRY